MPQLITIPIIEAPRSPLFLAFQKGRIWIIGPGWLRTKTSERDKAERCEVPRMDRGERGSTVLARDTTHSLMLLNGGIYTLKDERISENVDSNNDIVVKSWIPVPIQREFHQLSRQNDIPESDMMEPSLQQSAPVIKILIFATQYPSVYHVFFICKMAILGCI